MLGYIEVCVANSDSSINFGLVGKLYHILWLHFMLALLGFIADRLSVRLIIVQARRELVGT